MESFKKTIWNFYARHGRALPWRRRITPYRITVSEIMLQQTQVDRVKQKFGPFLEKFPDWQALARSSTRSVLEAWSGLGYNRRALYLKKIADIITDGGKRRGRLPQTAAELCRLPGIGENTAGAILAFARNRPEPFIETNIRSVFIHFFFKNPRNKVADSEIIPLLKRVLEDRKIRRRPRDWYYALMDYGSHLKRQSGNPSRRSAHHAKQKPFKGSNREMRSKILALLMRRRLSERAICRTVGGPAREQILKNLRDLSREGFISKRRGLYQIAA